MKKISAAMELKESIQILESQQTAKGLILKEQMYITYETLKPINILKKTLQDVSASPYLIDNILGSAVGMTSGFLSKRIFVGTSGNLLRKLLGSILQFGVTNVVAQHADTIKSIGQIVLQFFRHRKEMKSEPNDSR
jgi:hypothetical protein